MPRFLVVLMAVLSGLAFLVAAVGIYGVLAFAVTQRRHEFGVRIALGARPDLIYRGVLGEGLALAAFGAFLGTFDAISVSGLIRGLLFGIEPTDPATIAAVVLLSLAAWALACYGPARRATRIDPVNVLKAD